MLLTEATNPNAQKARSSRSSLSDIPTTLKRLHSAANGKNVSA